MEIVLLYVVATDTELWCRCQCLGVMATSQSFHCVNMYARQCERERDVNCRRGGVLVSILPVIEKDYAVAVV